MTWSCTIFCHACQCVGILNQSPQGRWPYVPDGWTAYSVTRRAHSPGISIPGRTMLQGDTIWRFCGNCAGPRGNG